MSFTLSLHFIFHFERYVARSTISKLFPYLLNRQIQEHLQRNNYPIQRKLFLITDHVHKSFKCDVQRLSLTLNITKKVCFLIFLICLFSHFYKQMQQHLQRNKYSIYSNTFSYYRYIVSFRK